MGIEQQLHAPSASQSEGSEAGLIISPRISPVPAKEPSHVGDTAGGGGGTTCAMGSPFRSTKIGFFVRFTFASKAKQVALNSDMDTSSIPVTFFRLMMVRRYHGH
jgi:hypothetical protein